MTNGAESLRRLRALLPVSTRSVLDYVGAVKRQAVVLQILIPVLCTAFAASLASATEPNAAFLNFPIVDSIAGAADTSAFSWTVRQGPTTSVLYAAGPNFKPILLFSKLDADGQPVSDLAVSPDARTVVFQTAVPFGGEHTYNPASLIEHPKPTLWWVEARAGEPHMSSARAWEQLSYPMGD